MLVLASNVNRQGGGARRRAVSESVVPKDAFAKKSLTFRRRATHADGAANIMRDAPNQISLAVTGNYAGSQSIVSSAC